jgi:hypothetical protein
LFDKEVRRDNFAGRGAAVGLGTLVLLGILVFFASGGLRLVQASKSEPVVLVIGLFGLGAVVLGIIALAAGSRTPTGSLVSGLLGGTTIGLGIVLLGVFVACAMIVDFFNTCARCKDGLRRANCACVGRRTSHIFRPGTTAGGGPAAQDQGGVCMSIQDGSPAPRTYFPSVLFQRLRRRPARLGVALLTLATLAFAFVVFALCACRTFRR